jgi:hypothetical protein
MKSNPYTPPIQQSLSGTNFVHVLSYATAIVAFVLLSISTIMGLVAWLVTDTLDEWTMPRFGWGGLLNAAFPLIILCQWFLAPRTKTLKPLGCILLLIALSNAIFVLDRGTTDQIENYYHDRLHSYWFWNVASHAMLGLVLLLVGFVQKSRLNCP